MKRKDLVKHLHGCELLREGRSHSIWVNPANEQQSTVPRHREINDFTLAAFADNWVPEP